MSEAIIDKFRGNYIQDTQLYLRTIWTQITEHLRVYEQNITHTHNTKHEKTKEEVRQ